MNLKKIAATARWTKFSALFASKNKLAQALRHSLATALLLPPLAQATDLLQAWQAAEQHDKPLAVARAAQAVGGRTLTVPSWARASR